MRALHIANGDHTASLIARAGLEGETSIWADPLHDGPVPAGLSDAELRAVRAAHLAAGDAVAPVLRGLESWSDRLDQRGTFDELVLWFEHDLFDQLNLIQVLDRLRPAPLTKTTLVSIREWHGKPSFKGMGELAPADIAALFDTRQRMETAAFELASRAWSAFRSDDPRDVEMILAGDTRPLPFLADALRRHRQEFPATHTGLSRSELRLLTQLDHAPADIWAAFQGMWDGETAFYIADSSFWDLIRGLADTEPALLIVERAEDTAGILPKGRLKLTLQGRSVLAGTVDRIHLCGIETWRGGVHLSGRGPQWRWNPDTGHIVRA